MVSRYQSGSNVQPSAPVVKVAIESAVGQDVTQLVPMHCAPAPHEDESQTQAPAEQIGVVPEHAPQEAPHFCDVLQGRHVPALHQLPLPHWLFVVHCTHVVPPLQTRLVDAQLVHDAPQ